MKYAIGDYRSFIGREFASIDEAKTFAVQLIQPVTYYLWEGEEFGLVEPEGRPILKYYATNERWVELTPEEADDIYGNYAWFNS